MTDEQLVSLVTAADSRATEFSGTFNAESEELLKAYMGLPYGDEEEGRSSLISTDVQDVVESAMPNLVRTFLSSSNIMKFMPTSNKDEDVDEAEAKTKYINWLIRKQPTSFSVLHSWFKDALIQKVSVVHYFVEDTKESKTIKRNGISNEEAALIIDDLSREDNVKKVTITESFDTESFDDRGRALFDVSFTLEIGEQKLQVIKIPSENFRVSRFTGLDINDAEITGHDEIMTRGELVSQGYDKETIDKIPRIGWDRNLNQRSNLKDIRFYDEDGPAEFNNGNEITDWASEEVIISNRYVKIDFDGDGIAERRYVRMGGRILLDNEPFDHVPYAPLSAILMPDKLIGRSWAELTAPTQRAKTVMLRNAADNTYSVNNPRMSANENVNLDDLLTVELNGIIRHRKETIPAQNMQAIEIPFIADKTLLMMNYFDQLQERRTGSIASSQGLNSDSLNQETATRFEGVSDAAHKKLELIARNFAETGIRKLYEGVAWMVQRYQNTELEVLIAGEELKVDPSSWRYEHHVDSEVGLAISDDEDSVQSLAAVSQYQQTLKAEGSLLVDNQKIYNTMERLVKGIGLGDVRDFFNNPEKPQELTLAQNEQMMIAIQQLTAQLQASQNPLAEAETINARKDLIEAQGKREVELTKIVQQQQQFNAKLQQENAKILQQQKENEMNFALKLTELEAKFNQQFNSQVQENKGEAS